MALIKFHVIGNSYTDEEVSDTHIPLEIDLQIASDCQGITLNLHEKSLILFFLCIRYLIQYKIVILVFGRDIV